MKRFIAILSAALMAGCALALAEDSSAPNTDAMNAGQTTSQGVSNDADQATQSATTTTKKSTTTAKADRTCTDDNGNVLKKGETGFKACWHKMHNKQESGISGATKDENKMDSNVDHSNSNSDNSMSNPSGSSDTSNQGS